LNTVQLLQQDLGIARFVLQGTMADVTPEIANWKPAGQAHPIGSAYLHILQGQDMAVHQMFQGGKPTIWQRDGWDKKTGATWGHPHTLEWARSVKVAPAQLQPYAKAVDAAVDAYIAGLTEQELSRKISFSEMGEQTICWLVQTLIVGHINNHTGEIAALKGVQGKKGYPF